MKQLWPVGQQAAAQKYDLLTALGAHACQGDKNLQRLVLRFITLIVARYNWQSDELSIGQKDIARLWAVDERTVKRDIGKLRDLGWLVQKRQAARGRVAVHGLDLTAILQMTRGAWPAVGTDFVSRMQGAPAVPQGNVVAFPGAPVSALPEVVTAWGRVQRQLQAEDPALFEAWFRALRLGQGDGALAVLLAPSRFHATFVGTHYAAKLQRVLRFEGMAGQGVQVIVDPEAR